MSKEHAQIEMDLAFGSAKPYGSTRSIVRRIATSLPIKPCPRVHFQLYPYTEDAGILIGNTRQNNLVASLADIAWIDKDDDDDEDYLGLVFRAHRSQRKPPTRRRSLPSLHQGAPDPQGPTVANDEAIQKISALETELAKLRAQIAQIVLAQEKNTQPGSNTILVSFFLSLFPGSCYHRDISSIDLIKERRGKKTDGQTVLDSRPAEIPNMLDVLKDMSKVKLRSVKSRPVEDDAKVKPSEPADAAALIAEALKRKFAHRYRNNSEHEDVEDFKLPVPDVKPQTETPLFGQHMLRATGKRKLL
uniref:Mitochondrial fission regulator n=1 Tax=Acanthochromis polyacanthus TaxID=80966 RepID=A0A3Q1FFD2_9TELE